VFSQVRDFEADRPPQQKRNLKHMLSGKKLQCRAATPHCGASGFTIAEVVVAVMVLATISTAFYLGLTSCFSVVKTSREDVRATQIMMQKLEAIRLCTWSELSNFSFQEPYDPLGTTNSTAGVYYFGTVSNSPATSIPDTSAYQGRMALVTVNLVWTNNTGGNTLVHTRQMQTQVARYGLQSYIWGAIQ
jgi:Tfp pilus assembly protein PilV